MSGGGGSSQNSSSSSQPFVPPYLRGIAKTAAGQEANAQGSLPSIGSLYGDVPQQGVAPLTGEQNNILNQYGSVNSGPNSTQNAALGTLGEYSSGGIGQDPATQAGLQAFSQLSSPQIAQEAALQGRNNSGAALEAQSVGQASVLAPYLENSQNQQLAAANSQFGAGSNLNTQQLNTLAAQLTAAGVPQQEAQQIANAQYNQAQGQFDYATGVQTAPFSLFGNMIGQTSTSSGTSSTGK